MNNDMSGAMIALDLIFGIMWTIGGIAFVKMCWDNGKWCYKYEKKWYARYFYYSMFASWGLIGVAGGLAGLLLLGSLVNHFVKVL